MWLQAQWCSLDRKIAFKLVTGRAHILITWDGRGGVDKRSRHASIMQEIIRCMQLRYGEDLLQYNALRPLK